jgi:hypothetical protein
MLFQVSSDKETEYFIKSNGIIIIWVWISYVFYNDSIFNNDSFSDVSNKWNVQFGKQYSRKCMHDRSTNKRYFCRKIKHFIILKHNNRE